MFLILFCKKKQILVKLKKLSAVDREGDAIIISYFFILSKIKKKISLKLQELYQIHLKYLHQQRLLILYRFFFVAFSIYFKASRESHQHDKIF